MKSIADFFARIQNSQAQKLIIYKIAQEAVKKHAGLDLDNAAISFRAKNLVLRGLGQMAKSQIFVKRPVILREINSQTTGKSFYRAVEDIKFEG